MLALSNFPGTELKFGTTNPFFPVHLCQVDRTFAFQACCHGRRDLLRVLWVQALDRIQ